MIKNKVLVLKKDATLEHGLEFKRGQEFEIVMDVVYMHGFKVQDNINAFIVNWIKANLKLFREDTRNF